MRLISFTLFSLILLSGCDLFIKKENQPGNLSGTPIARVKNKVLYLEDLEGLQLNKLSKQDSTEIVTGYIHNWIKKELLLDRAQSFSEGNNDEIENKVAKYREDLLLYEFEKSFINQKLDTVVSSKEITEFYEKNKSNFELKQNIVRGYFIKLPEDAARIEDVRNWIKSDNPKVKQELKKYCLRNASFFSVEDSIWVNFDDLIKDSPFRDITNPSDFLEKNRYSERTEGNHLYLLRIKDYKFRDQLSPLDYVKGQIRDMILAQRKVKMIQALEEEIYKNASKEGDIEVFNKK